MKFIKLLTNYLTPRAGEDMNRQLKKLIIKYEVGLNFEVNLAAYFHTSID